MTWEPASVPLRGEARVLLSSPRMSNATDTRPSLRDPSVVKSAKGAARTAIRIRNWFTPRSVLREFLKKGTASTAQRPVRLLLEHLFNLADSLLDFAGEFFVLAFGR